MKFTKILRKNFSNFRKKIREALKEEIKSRKRREKEILSQRGTRKSYDSHGEPVSYFKLTRKDEDIDYRVFFDIKDGKVVVLGIRPRNDDTYLNLRDYSRMVE